MFTEEEKKILIFGLRWQINSNNSGIDTIKRGITDCTHSKDVWEKRGDQEKVKYYHELIEKGKYNIFESIKENQLLEELIIKIKLA